ncbi:MAG: AtpZ/AtpI family protein [Microgenomates group bacterium]
MVNITEDTKKAGKRYEVSVYEDELIEKILPKKRTGLKQEKPALFYIGYVGQVGFMIALPIAGGAALGSYLDTKWVSYPKMTMIGLVLGIVISIINFIAVIKEIIKGAKT